MKLKNIIIASLIATMSFHASAFNNDGLYQNAVNTDENAPGYEMSEETADNIKTGLLVIGIIALAVLGVKYSGSSSTSGKQTVKVPNAPYAPTATPIAKIDPVKPNMPDIKPVKPKFDTDLTTTKVFLHCGGNSVADCNLR